MKSESKKSPILQSRYSLYRANTYGVVKHRGEYFLVGKWGGGSLNGMQTANYIGINGRRRAAILLLESTNSGRFVLGQVEYCCLLFAPDQTLLDTIFGKTSTIGQAYDEIDDVWLEFVEQISCDHRDVPKALSKSWKQLEEQT